MLWVPHGGGARREREGALGGARGHAWVVLGEEIRALWRPRLRPVHERHPLPRLPVTAIWRQHGEEGGAGRAEAEGDGFGYLGGEEREGHSIGTRLTMFSVALDG